MTKYVKSQNHSSYKKMVLAMAIFSALAGNYGIQAATYNKGMSGSVSDASWLTSATVSESDGVIRYDFDGKDHTFSITNHLATDIETPLYPDKQSTVVINNQNGTLHMNLVNNARNSFSGVAAVAAISKDNITINSNLDIFVKSDYLAEAFSLMGTDTHITVNGNVKIRRDDPENPWAIITNNIHGNYGPGGAVTTNAPNYTGARWEPSLIWNNGKGGSSITIHGDFDGASKGAGLVTDPYNISNKNPYTTCYINLNDGNVSIETPVSNTESYFAIANYGGTINVNVKDGSALNHTVKLLGNIIGTGGHDDPPFYVRGRTNLALTNKDSYWTGVIDNAGKNIAGEVNLWLQNSAVWTHESRSKTNGLQAENMPTPSNQGHYGIYDGVSYVTNLFGGKAENGAGILYQRDKAPIDIQNYKGYLILDYEHSNAGDLDSDYKAGDVTIHQATAGSQVIVSTDNKGIDMKNKGQVEKTLSALAHKLFYTAGNDNLKGKVQITEGLVTSGAYTQIGSMTFAANGKGNYVMGTVEGKNSPDTPDKPDTPDTPDTPDIPPDPDIPDDDQDITYTDYETGLMKGTRQAMMSSFLSWRELAQDTIHRGDVLRQRELGQKDGMWGKVSRGKFIYNDGSSIRGNHTTVQIGYDRDYGNGWLAGVGADYLSGRSSYVYGGKGDEKQYALSLYGSKDLGNDAYVDMTAKAGYIKNDFRVYNDWGRELDGKYYGRGYSFSVKNGKRYTHGTTYIEPSWQMTWSYLVSKDFSNTSGEDTMFVHQHPYSSVVGNIGIEAGYQADAYSLYGKFRINHEFAGDIKGDYSDGQGNLKQTAYETKGTWYDLALGGTYELSSGSQGYVEFSKGFGNHYKNDWAVQAGIHIPVGQGHVETNKPTVAMGTQEKNNAQDIPYTQSLESIQIQKTEPRHQEEKTRETISFAPPTAEDATYAEDTYDTYAGEETYTGERAPLSSNDTMVYSLAPVVVTANRVAQPLFDVKADISVVSRQEFETYHISNVEEALRTVPGVQFTNYSTNGMNGNINGIRINGSQDIVLLIDGVKVTDFKGPGANGYVYSWVLSNPDNIERIEVLRGSAATMYGSGAKGGVINIITRKINKTESTIDISQGNAGKENYRFHTQGRKGNLGYSLYSDRSLTGSYKDGGGVLWEGRNNTRAFGGKWSWNFNKDHSLTYSYDENMTKYSGFDPVYISPYNGTYSLKMHTLQDDWKFSERWAHKFTYRHSVEKGVYNKPWGEGDVIDEIISSPYSDVRDYKFDFYTEQVNYNSKKHEIVFGVDYSKGSGAAVNSSTDTGNASTIHTISNTSLYAQDEWKIWKRITLSGGIRYDKPNLSQASSHTAKSYKISWDITDKDTIYGGRSDYFIMPSMDQLYGTKGSNSELKPATGKTTSIGYNRKFSDNTFMKLSWFDTKADSDIYMVEETDAFGNPIKDENGDIKWHYENGVNRIRGWNAQLESQINDRLSARIGWAHLSLDTQETFLSHGYAPKDLITFGVTYDWKKWKTALDGYYFIRVDSETNHFENGRYGTMDAFPHDRYAVLNWSMDYAPNKDLSFYVKVENLLDTLYAEHTDVSWHPEAGPKRWYSLPGRSFLFGMKLRF